MDAVVMNVRRLVASSELTVSAGSTTSTLTVADPDEFDWQGGGTVTVGGSVSIAGSVTGGEVKAYTVDTTNGNLILGTALASTWPTGTMVAPYPPVVEYYADVKESPDDEELAARIPHQMVPLLAAKGGGGRVAGSTQGGATRYVEADWNGSDLVVRDVYGDEPQFDGYYLEADTIEARHITATAIDGQVITGATFRTSASNPRVILDSNGLRHVDSGGTTTFQLTGSGSGLNFATATGGLGTQTATISWGNSASPKAYITYWESGSQSALELSSQKAAGPVVLQLQDLALGGGGRYVARVVMNADAGGTSTTQFMDSAGSSSFLQKSQFTHYHPTQVSQLANQTAAAFQIYYASVHVLGSASNLFTGIAYFSGGTVAGNVRVALYDRGGTRIANRTTNFTPAGALTEQVVDFDSQVTIEPGTYWVLLSTSSATNTFLGGVSLMPSNNTGNGGVLAPPASITTTISSLSGGMPWMLLY